MIRAIRYPRRTSWRVLRRTAFRRACRFGLGTPARRVVLALVASLGLASCGHEPPTAVAPASTGLESPSKARPHLRWLARPRTFLTGARLGALAVTPQRMLATTVGPAADKIVSIDELGTMHSFDPGFSPPDDAVCHLAVSSGYRNGIPDGDVFVSVGADLWRLRPEQDLREIVLTLDAAHGDISGLCFDTTGQFHNDLLVLSAQGTVLRVGPEFVAREVGHMGPGGRGPSVHTTTKGARLVAAFPLPGHVRALSPDGDVSTLSGWSGVTAAQAFPQHARTYARTGAALFVATSNGQLLQFALADVAPHAGALLFTTLYASGSGLATPVGSHYELDPWSRHVGPEVAAAFVQWPAILRIDVDVDPGAPGGPLTLHSTTPVPVALLSAPWFAPNTVNGASLRCAGALAVPSGKQGFGTLTDINGDGEDDLVVSFRPADMDIDLSTTSVTLTGATFAEDAFRAEADVQVSNLQLRPRTLRVRRSIPAIGR